MVLDWCCSCRFESGVPELNTLQLNTNVTGGCRDAMGAPGYDDRKYQSSMGG